jgi:hypothetical protein
VINYALFMGFESEIERTVAAKRAGKASVAERSAKAFDECIQRWSELVDSAHRAAALLKERGVPYTPDVGYYCSHRGAAWPEGWRLQKFPNSGRTVLTATGDIRVIIDHDSYSPTREEKSYLEDVKNHLQQRHRMALDNPPPYNEESLQRLEAQRNGLLISPECELLIVDALMDDVADLLA